MKLYLISQDVNIDYDTYDSAVVVANSPEEAATLHPRGGDFRTAPKDSRDYSSTWCFLEDVKVTYIGKAASSYKEAGVILSSFNAG